MDSALVLVLLGFPFPGRKALARGVLPEPPAVRLRRSGTVYLTHITLCTVHLLLLLL